MIITNLIGGLGNQMFQYACGRAISLKTQQQLFLATDQFKTYKLHNGFELTKVFDIDVPEASEEDLASLLGFKKNPLLRRLLGYQSLSRLINKNCYVEPHFDYWPGVEKIVAPAYIQGYWQSERYFNDISNVIRDDFTFSGDWDYLDLSVRNRMASEICASIHVRRGDYIKGKKIHSICDKSYYISAVRILRDKIPKIRLFAFSDEPEWIKNYLEPELGEIEVVSHNTGSRSVNDMRLMSFADHHIIANSTFSWWGAWLNPSKEKIVVVPKKWFIDGRPTPTLIPRGWITI